MAIYGYSVSIGKRSSGQSAIAAAAYRHSERLIDERDGHVKDYSRKGHVEYSEIIPPQDVPDWVKDRGELWNTVERTEKRIDAQLYREALITLPRELPLNEQIQLVREFSLEQFVAKGMIADIAIHKPKAGDGQDQPHAHIMLTMRHINPEGFGKKNREWNAKTLIEEQRESWARLANHYLEKYNAKIDHRSLQDQLAEATKNRETATKKKEYKEAIFWEAKEIQLSREPEPKIGPIATQMRKQGRGAYSFAWADTLAIRRQREQRKAQAKLFDEAANQWLTQKERVSYLRSVAKGMTGIATSFKKVMNNPTHTDDFLVVMNSPKVRKSFNER